MASPQGFGLYVTSLVSRAAAPPVEGAMYKAGGCATVAPPIVRRQQFDACACIADTYEADLHSRCISRQAMTERLQHVMERYMVWTAKDEVSVEVVYLKGH